MEHSLIGMPLAKAKMLLEESKLDYEVQTIAGGKDKEILTEPYVLRVRNIGEKLELIVTKFKTTI
ncbi:MAG: hypothetical protein Q4D65_02875 [Peptostreptococcaceae bacterium]|nr:hypothetical protein [Peptostreptococcaceae bacterium]